ncbi:helix-turn-helix domain-containing protein [Lentzea sp. NPDC051213]|uniref:helix-turn-helix domain-containing protein n=1 Tax=Lentzea sp. NPDC051213 TaxID=3364126 RepID=UPI0037A4423C
MPALRKGVAVLKALAEQGSMSAAAIADDLQLPRSTTYHLLSVLGDVDLVEHRAGENRYALGAAAGQLGDAYYRANRLGELRLPPRPRSQPPPIGHRLHEVLQQQYLLDVAAALDRACQEQGPGLTLPPAQVLGLHFGLSYEWATTTIETLHQQELAELPPRENRHG